jgi:hypothetical protein
MKVDLSNLFPFSHPMPPAFLLQLSPPPDVISKVLATLNSSRSLGPSQQGANGSRGISVTFGPVTPFQPCPIVVFFSRVAMARVADRPWGSTALPVMNPNLPIIGH